MRKEQETARLVVRPSMKLVRAGYTAVFTVLFFAVLAYTNSQELQKFSAWVLLVPAMLLLWPLKHDLRCRFTRLVLAADKLHYETGMFSRAKSSIQLSMVQNVRVNQSFAQRLLGTGDVSVETAGETSLLTVRNVDHPDAVTDHILRAAQPETGERRSGRARG